MAFQASPAFCSHRKWPLFFSLSFPFYFNAVWCCADVHWLTTHPYLSLLCRQPRSRSWLAVLMVTCVSTVTVAHDHPQPTVTVEGTERHGPLSCSGHHSGHFPDVVASSSWNGEGCLLRDLGYWNTLSFQVRLSSSKSKTFSPRSIATKPREPGQRAGARTTDWRAMVFWVPVVLEDGSHPVLWLEPGWSPGDV